MKKKNKLEYSNAFFGVLLALFGLVLFFFYKQIIQYRDYPTHLIFVEAILNINADVEYVLVMAVYPLFHFTAKIFSFICMNDIQLGSSCVLTLANVASVVVMRRILNHMYPNASVRQKYVLDFLAVFYLIFETFAGPLTDGRIYARQCGPKPWHNPIITFVRPHWTYRTVDFCHVCGWGEESGGEPQGSDCLFHSLGSFRAGKTQRLCYE